MSMPVTNINRSTKWDLIGESERAGLERTPLGSSERPVSCTGCSEPLPTEGAFARHFILYNTTHLNLGFCPVKGPN